jgi:bacteriocin-like protein
MTEKRKTKPAASKSKATPAKKSKSRELTEKELENVAGGYLEGAPAGHPMFTTTK